MALQLTAAVGPDMIGDHGVKVSLVGHHRQDHTFLGPESIDTPYKTRWLVRLLNRQYYRLPVSVKVRVMKQWDPDVWPTSKVGLTQENNRGLRTVFGQKHHLDEHSIAIGSVQLSDALAHYWVMEPQKGIHTGECFEPGGHVAALYRDHLVEMQTGAAGRWVLNNFGIVFGAPNVVIYVEPTEGIATLNSVRTELSFGGGVSSPWERWANEFREQLPEPISEMEDETYFGC